MVSLFDLFFIKRREEIKGGMGAHKESNVIGFAFADMIKPVLHSGRG